jgi:DNA-binding NarL/FixJ family response regulator
MSLAERKAITAKANASVRGVARSPATRQAIAEALKAWHSEHPERAEYVGQMRLGTVHTGDARKRMGQAKRALSVEQVLECRRLRSEGWSLKRIAEALGFSVKPVFNALHNVGVYGEPSKD